METTTENKTHWRVLVTNNYIGAYSMPTDGSNIILTIKNVTREMVTGEGGKKEECTVAYFQEDSKPMILNRTNCKVIEKLHNTPFIEKWAGKRIEITVKKVKAFGDVTDALRVVAKVPPLPELKEGTTQFVEAVKFLKGEGTIERIQTAYIVSETVKKLLVDAASI
jgi:FKBP-type peptidyl-prolyl cis-trans isomerase 2